MIKNSNYEINQIFEKFLSMMKKKNTYIKTNDIMIKNNLLKTIHN